MASVFLPSSRCEGRRLEAVFDLDERRLLLARRAPGREQRVAQRLRLGLAVDLDPGGHGLADPVLGALLEPRQQQRPAAVDEVVDGTGGDDLAPQHVLLEVLGEALAQQPREVRLEERLAGRAVREVALQQQLERRHLRVAEQHAQQRPRQAALAVRAREQLLARGDRLVVRG